MLNPYIRTSFSLKPEPLWHPRNLPWTTTLQSIRSPITFHFLHHTGDGYLYLGEPVQHCCEHLFINENGDFLDLAEFSSSDITSPRAHAPLRADGLQHLNGHLARVQQAWEP